VRNYGIGFAGHETVAGRAGDVLELRPRHPGRPSYRLTVDAANRFPLRFQVLGEGGPVFEGAFEEIAFHSDFPPGIFEQPRRPGWLRVEHEEVSVAEASRRAPFPLWLPARLPAGFEARGAGVFRLRVDVPPPAREALREFLGFDAPGIDLEVLHVDYTDGVAALSVLECSAESDLWKLVRRLMARPGREAREGQVLVRKFADRRGTAYFMELDGTAVLAAGTRARQAL
jgi:negative regulator of sigma E activity